MACHGKSFIPSRASPSPKGNKLSKKVLTFSGSRQNPISVPSNSPSILSTIQVFVLVLSAIVLLVHIRTRSEHRAVYGIRPYSHGIIRVRVCPYPYPYGYSKERQRHSTGVHMAVNGNVRVHYGSKFDFS